MNEQRYNKSTILSIILHLLLLIAALTLHSANVVVPSRSDGMEVALVTEADVSPVERTITPPPPTPPIQVMDQAGDINVKQQPENKTLPKPQAPKVVQPKAKPPKNPTAKVVTKKKPNAKAMPDLNDLVNQLSPTKSTGKSKGAAVGGVKNGTSDSNNLINNYADQVINLVRPYVQVPDNMDSNTKAIVEVTLLPNMQVYKVRLLQSSGDTNYDVSVQQAIERAKQFPALPDGARWADYRILKLSFKPQ